ncbi:MAG: hypothetical protein WCP73_01130 [Eubacteriales bacterium]
MGRFLQLVQKPSFLACIVLTFILIYALVFIPVGMADNGGYTKTLSANNLSYAEANTQQNAGYFKHEYLVGKYLNESLVKEASSLNFFIGLAVATDSFFTTDAFFDIRFLAVLEIILLAVGIYLFVDYLTFNKPKVSGYLTAALTVFIFGDLAYGVYFNSFYAQGVMYISFIICIASALLLGQKRGYNPYFLIALMGASGVALVFAKPENAVLGAALAVLCVFIVLRSQLKAHRAFALVVAGILAASGMAVYALNPKQTDMDKFNSMTRGVMLTSQNPDEALSEFHINGQFAILNGTFAESGIEKDKALSKEFLSKFSYGDIGLYYMRHPGQFLAMANDTSEKLYTTRQAVGNYEKEAGLSPGAQTDFFIGFSTIKEIATPKTIGFLIVWCAAAILLGFKNRHQMAVVIACIAIGLIQVFYAVILYGNTEPVSDLFLYTLVFDFVNMIGFAWLINFIFGRKKKAKAIPLPKENRMVQKDDLPNGERRTRSSRTFKTCVCMLLCIGMAATGCSAVKSASETVVPSAANTKTEADNPSVKPVTVTMTDNEKKTFDFVRQKMVAGGGVRTNYLEQGYEPAYATGSDVLSESQGLYLQYLAQKKDEDTFKQVLAYTVKNLDNGTIFRYRYDVSGLHVYNMNAALDDLRIIHALMVAGESFHPEYTEQAKSLAKRFYGTNVANGFIHDIYDSDHKAVNSTITLCYIDLNTIQSLSRKDATFQTVYGNMLGLLKNGRISDAFPMYYTQYSYTDSKYGEAKGINMVQSMLCALHLAEIGECPADTIQLIRNKVSDGELFGEYDLSGKPVGNVQSTALYAIAAMIGRTARDTTLYDESISQMQKFMVTDANSKVYGAFADANTNSAYSFDNLMALLAYREGDQP